MVRCLMEAIEVVVRTAREVVRMSKEADDPASLDLAVRRLTVHEKTLWMLRATAAGFGGK